MMNQLLESAATAAADGLDSPIAQFGSAAVIITGLALAVRTLWAKLNSERDMWMKLLQNERDARIADSRETLPALVQANAAMTEFARVATLLRDSGR